MTQRGYRLSEQLARRRMLYPSSTIAAPSVLVIDVSPRHRGAGLALGRYYAIVLETDDELKELQRFLDAPRLAPVPPDLFDHRPSRLRSDNVLISRYEPPEEGWPWLLVCRWPESYAAAASGIPGCDMARGCYTTELFDKAEDVDSHSLAILQLLNSNSEISVRLIAADVLPPGGSA